MTENTYCDEPCCRDRTIEVGEFPCDQPCCTSDREAFMAGYRRALEDAAGTPFAEEAGVSWEDCDPETGDQVIYRESMREFLTARAAAVAPRETKD